MAALAGCSASAVGSTSGAACAPEDIKLIGQVRNETNPYEKSWLDGGQELAESLDLEQKRLTYAGESPKQLEQIRQELSTGNPECMVLNVLPNSDSDTTPIVKAVEEAGAHVVTQWNKPADVHPWDGYDSWIAHITYDGVDSGYQIAKAMFESMGGEGNVIALQGILATAAAKDRFAGLELALEEYPGITLLDQQAADFDRTKAFDITKTLLTKYGADVGGVWAANDDMALGALKALDAAGLAGEVKVVGIDAVPEAVQAIEDGAITATVSSDGPWQGGIGLAMGYCALTGELDVTAQPNKNREFFAKQFLVTEDNAADYLTPSIDLADFDCANVFNRVDKALG
ncbi:sugar ABC transporter substrate-binding protein [Cryobacterium adonitolivorans]|nr:sugar ABC transporter substrate-binding protein [Cryobacterium adonitolivorans]